MTCFIRWVTRCIRRRVIGCIGKHVKGCAIWSKRGSVRGGKRYRRQRYLLVGLVVRLVVRMLVG